MSASDLPETIWTDELPSARRHRRRPRARWSPDQFLGPLALAATAPLAFFPERFPVEAMAIGLGMVAVPYLVRRANGGHFGAAGGALWVVLLLAGVAAPIGALVSPAFWEVSWPELVRLVWGAAVLLGVLYFCADGGGNGRRHVGAHVAVATAGFFAVGLALGAIGLLSMRANDKLPLIAGLVDRLPAINGALPFLGNAFNPNRVASVVMLFVAPALALLLASPGREMNRSLWWLGKGALLGLALFFGGALLLTQSRTGLLAAALASGLVCLLAGRRGWLVLGVGLLLAVATLDVFGPQGVLDVLAVQGEAPPEAGSLLERVLADRNMAGRLMIWRRAWYGIGDAPLTGVGLGVFQLAAREPYPALPDYRPDPDITHAHNLFLQTGLDLGLPGLLALMALLGFAVAALVRLFRATAPGTPARLWAVGMAGALLAFLVFNLLDAVTLGARP
ncbi:MAG TPA: O-antigen ligase family protein, partial [Caldilineaceae bacterium]|nr:O-antigen ligase family protein [Caldilineaceae bacterium]